jgi:hypothetical protein
MGDDGDDGHGCEEHADRERQDRPQVASEIAPGGQDRRAVEEGRDEDEEQRLGIDFDPRQARDQREGEAAEDQKCGVRDSDAVGDDLEERRQRVKKEDQLQVMHGKILTRPADPRKEFVRGELGEPPREGSCLRARGCTLIGAEMGQGEGTQPRFTKAAESGESSERRTTESTQNHF